MWQDALLFAAVAFAAIFVHSFAGFGSALVAMPLLALFVDPKLAVPSFAMMVLVLDVLLLIETRAHVEWRQVVFLLLGGIVGSPIGAFALKTLPADQIKLALNIMMLALVALLWLKVRIPVPDNRPTRVGVGLVSGLLGGSMGTSGPPIVLFALARQWEKDSFRGTLLAYFTCLTVVTVSSYGFVGLIGRTHLILAAAAIAGALPAAWLGVKLKNRASEGRFTTVVLAIVTLTALVGLGQYLGLGRHLMQRL